MATRNSYAWVIRYPLSRMSCGNKHRSACVWLPSYPHTHTTSVAMVTQRALPLRRSVIRCSHMLTISVAMLTHGIHCRRAGHGLDVIVSIRAPHPHYLCLSLAMVTQEWPVPSLCFQTYRAFLHIRIVRSVAMVFPPLRGRAVSTWFFFSLTLISTWFLCDFGC